MEIIEIAAIVAALIAAAWAARWRSARRDLMCVLGGVDRAHVRRALRVGPHDRLLLVGGSGDDALDFLLENPAGIVAADPDPWQLYLLELKRAAIRALYHDDLFAIFGRSDHAVFQARLPRLLKNLSPEAAAFWSGPGDAIVRRNLFLRGTPVARRRAAAIRVACALSPATRRLMDGCRDASSIEEQRALYAPVKTQVDRWVRRLAGEDAARRIHALFEDTWIAGSPPWRARLYGAYTPACCPRYLRPESLPLLKTRIDRIQLEPLGLVEAVAASPVGWFTRILVMDATAGLDEAQIVDHWTTFQARAPDAEYLLRAPPLSATLASLDVRSVAGGLTLVTLPRRLRIFPRPDGGAAALRRLAQASPVIAGGVWVHLGEGGVALAARMGTEGVQAFERVILDVADNPEALAGRVDLVTLSSPTVDDIERAARLVKAGGFVAALGSSIAVDALARAVVSAHREALVGGAALFLGRGRAAGDAEVAA